MDKITFDAELTTELGGNLIDVELTDEDFNVAFKNAKQIFIQRGNNNMDRQFYSLDVIADTNTYTLPAESNIDTVTRLIKPRGLISGNDPFSVAYVQSMFRQTYSGGANLLVYELTSQYLENVNKYTAYDTNFIYKPRSFELTLLDKPVTDATWILDCYANLTDDEYRDMEWIADYALAECKIILGRAYSKFQSLSSPTGETSLNGEALISEGREDKTQLLEDIKNYVDGAPAGGIILMG